jgi:hypothetical protein
MPRKKTVQPPPLKTLSLEDDTVVEIRDETCEEIGRGLHRYNAHNRFRDAVWEWVVEDHILTKIEPGELIPDLDILERPTKFSNALQQTELYPEYGPDDSHIRKRLYSEIRREIRIINAALRKLKGTSSDQND